MIAAFAVVPMVASSLMVYGDEIGAVWDTGEVAQSACAGREGGVDAERDHGRYGHIDGVQKLSTVRTLL